MSAPGETESTRTNYSYDGKLRATGVSKGASAVGYSYASDLLSAISTASGTDYSFAYGAFDLVQSIQAGSRTLISHSYSADGNHQLTRSDYGNGDSVSYGYDSLGRTTSVSYEDGAQVDYTYDNNGNLGLLTDSASGRRTQYFYDFQDRLMRWEQSGSGYANSVTWGYDDNNNLSSQKQTLNGTTYNTTSYTYDKDNHLTETTEGTVSAGYTYDAWGNPLSTTGSMAATLGEQNHLRYRGYVYDTETGLYYLQSRYYNPTWGRFINADGYASTGQGIIGNNMFAYCGNNPVKHLDPQGTFFKEIGGFFKRVLSNLKRNFTMKANVSRVYNRKTIYFGGLITVERGTTVKTTTSPNRKMQKQPTIYSDVDRSDPSDSSVGITIPRMNSEFDIHLGVSDTGITHSYNMGETVMGSGCRVDFKDFRTGLFFSKTRANGPYITTTDYIYISMDGEAAIAVLVFIGSGQWIPGKMPLQPSVLG